MQWKICWIEWRKKALIFELAPLNFRSKNYSAGSVESPQKEGNIHPAFHFLSSKNFIQFEIESEPWSASPHFFEAEMDQTTENHDLSKYNDKIKAPMKEPRTRKRSNKCNQCDFSSSWVGNLRTYLKTHSGEGPNKCNQCEYISSDAGHLSTHLKIHSGEKSNKCSQWDYAMHPLISFLGRCDCFSMKHKWKMAPEAPRTLGASWSQNFKSSSAGEPLS